ncbi:hypothetical protein BU24DRAFT_323083, partial [Aaosphaeria arxii CBS 175.79]
MVNRFMTLTQYGGEPTPMDAIQRLKAFGMSIRFNTNAEGVVDWIGDTLSYGNIRFSMPQLRSMVHGLIASTRRHVIEALLLLPLDEEGDIRKGGTALPIIHWDRLVDNAAERKTGWSFMEDTRNREAVDVVDPKEWLARRVGSERALTERFIDMVRTRAVLAADPGRGAAVWKMDELVRYRRAMATARKQLAACMHMTGGAPARGTELTSVQFRNSANGESRGIFIEDGL